MKALQACLEVAQSQLEQVRSRPYVQMRCAHEKLPGGPVDKHAGDVNALFRDIAYGWNSSLEAFWMGRVKTYTEALAKA